MSCCRFARIIHLNIVNTRRQSRDRKGAAKGAGDSSAFECGAKAIRYFFTTPYGHGSARTVRGLSKGGVKIRVWLPRFARLVPVWRPVPTDRYAEECCD